MVLPERPAGTEDYSEAELADLVTRDAMVGVAQVPAGCKNSAIGISSDGDRVYYIDIQGSKILVLARTGGSGGSE